MYFSLVAAYWPEPELESPWAELRADGWVASYCWVLERIPDGRQAAAEPVAAGAVAEAVEPVAVAWQAAEPVVEPVDYWAGKAVRNGYPAGCPEEWAG